jgi:6-phosphogluconolactonase
MPLYVEPNTDVLMHTVANWMVNLIGETLKKQGRFTLALSGGNTPKSLHQLLASAAFRDKIDWGKIHFFFGDERFVPFNDVRNNAKMAFDTLLNLVPVVPEQIHIMQTENITPEASAEAYENILHQYFNDGGFSFDLVLLGMGDDGHTLSLFPGTSVIDETKKWVTNLWLAAQDMYRITLTAPIVNQSAHVAFLTTGANKAQALKAVLEGPKQVHHFPAQIIQPKGKLHWFTDVAAAALLTPSL